MIVVWIKFEKTVFRNYIYKVFNRYSQKTKQSCFIINYINIYSFLNIMICNKLLLINVSQFIMLLLFFNVLQILGGKKLFT